MPQYRGDWIIVALVGAPLLAALVLAGLPGDAEGWLNLAGRLTGIAGLACMLVTAAISLRIPRFDRLFGGLTRLWRIHHNLGLWAFVLILAHPILMALARVPVSLPAAAEVLLPRAADWPMWAGWVGLLALIVFLTPSFQFFGRPEYQRWKLLHFTAGLALLAGLIHTLPLSRLLESPWHIIIWGSLGTIALVVFVWRATIARPLQRRRYRVTEREQLADDVVEISVIPEDGPVLDHDPAQFIYFTPRDRELSAGYGEEHPFTLSSAPGEGRLRFAIKDLGDASHALQSIRLDTPCGVDGPYGYFFPAHRRSDPQIWVGGGIGITPFVSAARAMADGMDWGPVHLIYCANDRDRAYFLPELERCASAVENLTLIPHLFVEEGPLTHEFLRQHCGAFANRRVIACGPPVLNELIRDIARTEGVPKRHFYCEEFTFL